MYVDYDYYKNEFAGDLGQADFLRYERQAEAYICYLTMRQKLPELDAVRDAVCAVTDIYAAAAASSAENGGRERKSENNDGYSVTFVTERQDGETWEGYINRKASAAARAYLLPTGLLNRSVGVINHDHKCGYHCL